MEGGYVRVTQLAQNVHGRTCAGCRVSGKLDTGSKGRHEAQCRPAASSRDGGEQIQRQAKVVSKAG